MEYKEKCREFAKLVAAGSNYRQAAISVGYNEKSAHKRGSELAAKPDVKLLIEMFKNEQSIESDIKIESTNIKELAEESLPAMLEKLKGEPEKFIRAYLQILKSGKDVKDEYEGYTIAELRSEIKTEIENSKELERRIEDAIREGVMQE